MINSLFVRACVLVRLHQNPLQPHLEELATTLYKQGYVRGSIQDSVPAISSAGWQQRQAAMHITPADYWLARYEQYLEQVVGAAVDPVSATVQLFGSSSQNAVPRKVKTSIGLP